jgi:hypothetical protein
MLFVGFAKISRTISGSRALYTRILPYMRNNEECVFRVQLDEALKSFDDRYLIDVQFFNIQSFDIR